MKLENLIFKMLTENTGSALCDSGGAYGRNWQKNQNKTLKDFKSEPEAELFTKYGFDVTISLFHHLTKTLSLDEYCEKFNKLKCDDWDGDFYGTSKKQCAWLEKNDFIESERGEFNSYNWSAPFSQVVQGTFLKQGGYVDEYVLLQIHGGCDVRGGYTNAKLFKVNNDYFLYDYASFSIDDNLSLDVQGDDVQLYNHETCNSELLDYTAASEFVIKQGGEVITGFLTY